MFKKKVVLVVFFLVLVAFMFLAGASEDPSNQRVCKKQCSMEKRNSSRQCNINYRECKAECSEIKKLCVGQAKGNLSECREQCELLEDRDEKKDCRKECSITYRDEMKECKSKECKNACRNKNKVCRQASKDTYDACKDLCVPKEKNEELQGYNFTVSEEICLGAGGLYQQLCKGPYFRLTCSTDFYCQCAGFEDFSCPQDYGCVVDHGIKVRGRSYFHNKFVDYLGRDLGDIGICGKLVEGAP